MSVLWVRNLLGGGDTVGANGERTFNRLYLVKSDDPHELREVILEALSAEEEVAYGRRHGEDATALCSRINPERSKQDPYLWQVAVEWHTKHGGSQPDDDQLLPDQRRQRWTYRFSQVRKFRSRDLDGRCFKDSAWTPFNPPPTVPIIVDEWTVRGYAGALTRWADREFMNACNSEPWFDLLPGEAMIENITASDEFEMGQWWWVKQITILVSPKFEGTHGLDEWDNIPPEGGFDYEYILDAGPKKLVDANGAPPSPGHPAVRAIPIADDVNGTPYLAGSPVLLDGQGRILAANAEEVYLRFRTKNEIDFNLLGLAPPS